MASPKSTCGGCLEPVPDCVCPEDDPLAPPPECDAHLFGAAATVLPGGSCRCLVCPRCGHHTGNATQGHYWRACRVLADRVRASGEKPSMGEFITRTSREHHFCCPDPAFGCSLEEAG